MAWHARLAVGLLAAASAALLMVPAGAAQEDGCDQADPCLWIVGVDDVGFVDDATTDESPLRTVGDWFTLEVYNEDDRAHDVEVEGATPEVLFTVPSFDAGGEATSVAFRFETPGQYAVLDKTTGARLDVTVIAEDAVAAEEIADEGSEEDSGDGDGSGGDSRGGDGGKDGPFLGVLLTAGALVAFAMLRRMR